MNKLLSFAVVSLMSLASVAAGPGGGAGGPGGNQPGSGGSSQPGGNQPGNPGSSGGSTSSITFDTFIESVETNGNCLVRSGVIWGYVSGATTISPDSTITNAIQGAFAVSSTVTTANLSNSKLDDIHKEMFDGASALSSVTLPSSVTEIGRGAFANCESLEAFDITSVTNIKRGAFMDSPLGDNIKVNDDVELGDLAFSAYTMNSFTAVNTSGNDVMEDNSNAFVGRVVVVTEDGIKLTAADIVEARKALEKINTENASTMTAAEIASAKASNGLSVAECLVLGLAVDDETEATFEITSIEVDEDGNVTVTYNGTAREGTVVVQGKENLSDAEWHTKISSDRFFRVVLEL